MHAGCAGDPAAAQRVKKYRVDVGIAFPQ